MEAGHEPRPSAVPPPPAGPRLYRRIAAPVAWSPLFISPDASTVELRGAVPSPRRNSLKPPTTSRPSVPRRQGWWKQFNGEGPPGPWLPRSVFSWCGMPRPRGATVPASWAGFDRGRTPPAAGPARSRQKQDSLLTARSRVHQSSLGAEASPTVELGHRAEPGLNERRGRGTVPPAAPGWYRCRRTPSTSPERSDAGSMVNGN